MPLISAAIDGRLEMLKLQAGVVDEEKPSREQVAKKLMGFFRGHKSKRST